MKKLISLLIIFLLLAVSCTDQINTTLVEKNENIRDPNILTLPAPDNPSLEKITSVSQMIYGSDESLIEINTGYAGGPFGWVSITANARFKKNSFTGQKYVTMSIDDEYIMATFLPQSTFSKPVIYNFTIIGVDLSGVNPSEVDFVYLDPNGKYEKIKYHSIFIEKQSGKLQITDAELPHFSRYVFVRKSL